jgi:hypothetical protein
MSEQNSVDHRLTGDSTYTTYGVSDAGPILRIWVFQEADAGTVIHADLTIPMLAFAPHNVDKLAWCAANLDRVHDFMRHAYGLGECVSDDPSGEREILWDSNGDIWFTGYAHPTVELTSEKQAYELAISDTKITDVNHKYIGYEYRRYLGEIWARGCFGEFGTVAPSADITDVLTASLNANFEDVLGFDALGATLTGEQRTALKTLTTKATGHPAYVEFSSLNVVDEDSDDIDDVNELSYMILSETFKRIDDEESGQTNETQSS